MMRYKQLYVITDTGPPCKNRHAASTRENLPVKGLNQTYDLHTGQD